MKILLLGSGGREHAFAWKIAQSAACEALFIAPGNAGTAELGTNVKLNPSDFEAVWACVQKHQIDCVVVGPEQPLVEGIADYLRAKDVAVVGPSKAGAQLEGSKQYSKDFMQKNGIPTATFASFNQDQLAEALDYVGQHPLPIVVKASGLAAGKGVLICETYTEAKEVVEDMLSGQAFGEAGRTIVIEQFLKGIEISIFVLTDGKNYMLLPSAKDYKRIGEGDTGLNTGGMGAISPVPFANEAFIQRVEKEIVQPTLQGLQVENIPYKGFIFIGLMVVEGIPYVLEYNVRMGDPETEVVLPRIDSDFVELLEGVIHENLNEKKLKINPQTCATIMLVSGGYPESYEKGKLIDGLDRLEEAIPFHAGTKKVGEQLLTNGGRVLALSAFGTNIAEAVGHSLRNAARISFEGKYYRRDIGRDLM